MGVLCGRERGCRAWRIVDNEGEGGEEEEDG